MYVKKEAVGGDEESQYATRRMRSMMGPQAVDHTVRQAISTCWMMLPSERRTVEAVEVEIRRLVDRALKDLQEDARAFGLGEEEETDPAIHDTRKPLP
jgi:hypothetical protein